MLFSKMIGWKIKVIERKANAIRQTGENVFTKQKMGDDLILVSQSKLILLFKNNLC